MNNGAWEDIQAISNEDVGKKIRVKVSGRTDGEKIYIRAVSNDSGSGQASYSTPVFVKIGKVLEIITKPMMRSTKPELVNLKLKCRIPDDAEMHVYVSNNASDDEPTWEEYQIDEYHSFTNNENTSEQWAVAAKIVVNANESTEEISVEAIGIGVL